MNVTDPAKRKFKCSSNENGRMTICSQHQPVVNFVFSPAIPFNRTDANNCVIIDFTVTQSTKLIINFTFPNNFGGKYDCELVVVNNSPNKKFIEPVPQMGIIPQRRTYTFEF